MVAVVDTMDAHKHAARRDLAALLLGVAALIFALAVLLNIVWHIVASTVAVPFDADGVRCYGKAEQIVCLKTAEPPR
jgi:hypothetical protein